MKHLPQGYKQTQFGTIPEDWKVHQLSSLGRSFSGLSGKKKDEFGQGKPYIPYMNIFKNTVIDEKHFDYVRVAKNEKQHKVFHGDIFFTTSSETPQEVGMSSVYMGNLSELYLNSFCFGLRLHNFGTVLPTYLSYFFRGSLGRKLINRLAQGATRFNLSKKNFFKTLIPLPPLPEQQKIATILSTWDQAIASIQSIIDTLTLRNKGLAQQLLTGNKRLKGFQGSWREERLGNLLKEVKSDVVKSPQQYELLNVKLYGKGISKTGKFPKKTTKGRTYHFRRPGEIIIGRQNFHNGSIALMPTLKGKLIASSAISSFFAVKEVDTQWILHYLLRPSFYTWIANLIGGTGQKEISRKDFNTILIIVPPLEEQKAISQVLVDAEEEVKLYKKKLDKLQEQKKGLMQKLLTGSIRVPT